VIEIRRGVPPAGCMADGSPERDSARTIANREQAALRWFLVVACGVLCWAYFSLVADPQTTLQFLRRPWVDWTTVGLVVLPALLLWKVEISRGRLIAARTLVLLACVIGLLQIASAHALGPAGAAPMMVAAAYGFGSRISGLLGCDPDCGIWQGAPIRITMGFAALMFFGTILGIVGWLTRPAILAVCVVGVLLGAVGSLRLRQGFLSGPVLPGGTVAVFWWWGWVVLVQIAMVGALAPEVRSDALTMHLPIAREFAESGIIADLRHHIMSYLPMSGAVLYAEGMLLFPGEGVPKLLHFSAAVLGSLLACPVSHGCVHLTLA